MSDPGRGSVAFRPAATSLAEIAKLDAPPVASAMRTSAFERHLWTLDAVVDRFRIASNGEIVLILYDIPSARYMDVYLPNPDCLGPRSRGRPGILAARQEFTKNCPHATSQWQLLGATVQLAGVGFWNPVTTTRGALPNGAELRPVTNLKFLSGCGVR